MKEYRTHDVEINGVENYIYLNLRVEPRDLQGNIEEVVKISYKMNSEQTKDLLRRVKRAMEALRDIKDEEDGIKIFTLNEYLKLKFENNQTNIYVDDEKFRQCKYLLFNLDKNNLEQYDEIRSIDEMADEYMGRHEQDRGKYNSFKIEPIEEFQGHCSNLQAWVEHDYNTALLRNNLAFPLLKKLVEVGDPKAKGRYKDEIAVRLASNELTITKYLIKQKYLENLTKEEIEIIIDDMKPGIAKVLLKNRDNTGKYNFIDKIMALKNDDFIISDLKNNPVAYDDYKKAFPLSKLEKYSQYLYNKTMVDFGLKWRDQRIVFKMTNLNEAMEIFESDKKDIMIQIPRTRAPLKLYMEKENLAIYFYPILIF
jgi:hypothetical protein